MSTPIERLGAALAGRYTIEREIGSGGMATVYLATDVRHDRQVALKVLRPELAAVIGADRFLAEIRTTANLQHPHILALHDSGEVDGTVFYVMPFVEGESLRDRLDREKQIPIPEAIKVATEVAGALDYAHRKGVVHRDIKPANILLQDGRVLVADFGIALAASRSEGSDRLTETGMSLGTPHYMSPEQAMGERGVDGRSDVYALGCVLYEMLAGEPPFSGPNAQAIIAKLITGDPTPLQDLRRTVPEHVAAVAATALQKLPADRFATAGEMEAALQDRTLRLTSAVRGEAAAAAGRGPMAWLPWGVAAAGMLWGIAGALNRPAPDLPVPARFTIVSTDRDGVRPGRFLVVSRDGRDIVFDGASEGATRLYRRALGSPTIEPLPGTEGALSPAFLPDGRSVSFWADGMIRQVALDGGNPSNIAPMDLYPGGVSWSEEAGLVVGMLIQDPLYLGLKIAPVRGDTAGIPLTRPPLDGPELAMHHDPFVLPGETEALFAHIPLGENAARPQLGIVSLEGQGERGWEIVDLPTSSLGRGGSFVGVSQGLLFFTPPGGTLNAIEWDEERREAVGEPFVVPGVPLNVRSAALSWDGTLAMSVRADLYDVVVVDDRGGVQRLLPAEQVSEFVPRISPDGARAAISADLRGQDELWTADLSSGELTQLGVGFGPDFVDWVEEGSRVIAGEWQSLDPNGSFAGSSIYSRPSDASLEASVFFRSNRPRFSGVHLSPAGDAVAFVLANRNGIGSQNLDVLVTPSPADTALVPFAALPQANEVTPRFSPDGNWLAYASDESGRYQVYARPYPGPGPRTQISDQSGGQPLWSSSGDRMFYRTDRGVVAADYRIDEQTGALVVTGREALFEGEFLGGPDARTHTYDVTPDGRRFLLATASEGRTPEIIVWTNWIPELKAQRGIGGGG